MRVLVVLTYYYPHWTGLTTHAVRVAEGLAERKHTVTVLTTRHLPELARDEIINGVRVIRLQPIGRFSRGMIVPAFVYAAPRLIAQSDIVQIHTPLPEALMVATYCRLLGRPLVMTHHGDLVMPAGLVNQALQHSGYVVLSSTARLADAVTTYSADYAAHSTLLRPFKGKVTAIYPPVEIPEPDMATAQAWRSSLGLNHKPTIGFAGRWVEEKGFDYLLQALPIIQKELPEAHLVYAGERHVVYDNFFARCLPLIEAHPRDLTFLGLLREPQAIANFYAMCDVFVQPSRTDMMGLVQVEALLSGTPVVVSDIPGARVVVRDCGFGRLAPPADPPALAQNIVEVLKNRERYKPSRAAVRSLFNTERTLSHYEELLGRIVRERSRSRPAMDPGAMESVNPDSEWPGRK